MVDGRIVRSGGPEVAESLEDEGYDTLRREVAIPGEDADPLLELLVGRAGVRVIGRTEADHAVREPTVAFASDRVTSRAVYEALVAARVSCGHGHFYAHRLVTALGLDPADGVVRLSMVHYTSPGEVARALDVLDQVL